MVVLVYVASIEANPVPTGSLYSFVTDQILQTNSKFTCYIFVEKLDHFEVSATVVCIILASQTKQWPGCYKYFGQYEAQR